MKEAQAERGFGNLISNELSLGTSRLEFRATVLVMFPSGDPKVWPLVQMLMWSLFRRETGMAFCATQAVMWGMTSRWVPTRVVLLCHMGWKSKTSASEAKKKKSWFSLYSFIVALYNRLRSRGVMGKWTCGLTLWLGYLLCNQWSVPSVCSSKPARYCRWQGRTCHMKALVPRRC